MKKLVAGLLTLLLTAACLTGCVKKIYDPVSGEEFKKAAESYGMTVTDNSTSEDMVAMEALLNGCSIAFCRYSDTKYVSLGYSSVKSAIKTSYEGEVKNEKEKKTSLGSIYSVDVGSYSFLVVVKGDTIISAVSENSTAKELMYDVVDKLNYRK